jgi:hypothetical protein
LVFDAIEHQVAVSDPVRLFSPLPPPGGGRRLSRLRQQENPAMRLITEKIIALVVALAVGGTVFSSIIV